LRYGRLWRQGIPYLTLMENNINHPNVFGPLCGQLDGAVPPQPLTEPPRRRVAW
jgi:hypothetical protein